nr:LysM peptidoglycan-binding domain-containing protein [Paenibacillus turpanensis]
MVKQGETLNSLIEKYNVDLEKLVAANPRLENEEQLVPGIKVKIPSAPVVMTAPAADDSEKLENATPADVPAEVSAEVPAEAVQALEAAENAETNVSPIEAAAVENVQPVAEEAPAAPVEEVKEVLSEAAEAAANLSPSAQVKKAVEGAANVLSNAAKEKADQFMSPLHVTLPEAPAAQPEAQHPFQQFQMPAVPVANMADYPNLFMPYSYPGAGVPQETAGYAPYSSQAPYPEEWMNAPYTPAYPVQQQKEPCSDCGHPLGTYAYPMEEENAQAWYGYANPLPPNPYPSYPSSPGYPGIGAPTAAYASPYYPQELGDPGYPNAYAMPSAYGWGLPGTQPFPEQSNPAAAEPVTKAGVRGDQEESIDEATASGAISAPEMAALNTGKTTAKAKPVKARAKKKTKSRTIVRVRSAYSNKAASRRETEVKRTMINRPWLNQ